MSTYFVWVGAGTFEREWAWLHNAAEIKHAIADSEPTFVVAAWATRRPAYPGASLPTAVAVRPARQCVRCRFGLALTRRHSRVVARGALNHQRPTTEMFLSDRFKSLHLTAGGARSAQRTLAGEGVLRLPRDVETVNPAQERNPSVTKVRLGAPTPFDDVRGHFPRLDIEVLGVRRNGYRARCRRRRRRARVPGCPLHVGCGTLGS
jgi:hypothetical protein